MLAMFFFLFGSCGLLAATWLFPVMARLLFKGSAPKGPSASTAPSFSDPSQVTMKAVILIPAFNEEANIARTIPSIQRSIDEAKKVFKNVQITIQVGADGCTDGTPAKAESLGAKVTVFEKQQGKWRTLLSLVNRHGGDCDWVILADAGIIWPEELLVRAIPLCMDPTLMALAPTYRTPGAGAVEKLVWKIERYFKGIESELGGPVSIHGATVFYRLEQFRHAQKALMSGNYLNDDVVFPLTLRAFFPEKRILYTPELGVYDQLETKKVVRTFRRRKRLVLGNVQWIRGILPEVLKRNPVVGVLALRRVFRLFWAYWGISFAITLPLVALQYGLLENLRLDFMAALGALILAAAYRLRATLINILDSVSASLLAPYYLLSTHHAEKGTWK